MGKLSRFFKGFLESGRRTAVSQRAERTKRTGSSLALIPVRVDVSPYAGFSAHTTARLTIVSTAFSITWTGTHSILL
jgi:hypothetical protein